MGVAVPDKLVVDRSNLPRNRLNGLNGPDGPMSTPAPATRRRITGKTKLIALLGSPVSHSRSPQMQNGVFEALGLDFAYLAFDVGLDRVGDAVSALRTLGIRGANVTMPLKRAICSHLDQLSNAAEMAGAVNVIVNDDGVLTGHITDGVGYMASLAEAGVATEGKTMTIVGVGGAATAVAIQAAMQGVKCIHLFNARDDFFNGGEATAQMLQNRLGCEARFFDLADAAALKESIACSDIFVNGTPVGMEATLDQAVIPDASYFHRGLTVSDLIYVPEQTTLLRMARDAGCKTVSGMGMQLFQAVDAFRLWTGRDMPVELARQHLFG
ncbi:MAG: shikimate 5-dehydrogenase [Pseudomonadota bacterium]